MGFLGGAGMAGAAGGANQALQNFLQFYLQNKDLKQKKKERVDREKYYQSLITENEAQAAERTAKVQKETNYQKALEALNRQNEIMGPAGAGMEIPQDPYGLMSPGLMQELGNVPIGTGQYAPPTGEQEEAFQRQWDFPEYMKNKAVREGREDKQPPILTQLIKAAQDGTITEQGKAILAQMGYGDLFTAKPTEGKTYHERDIEGWTLQQEAEAKIKAKHREPRAERVPTTADIKQVGEMVAALNKTAKPNQTDIELTKTAADKVGYKLEKVVTDEKTPERYLFSKDWSWGGKEPSEWRLVPKEQRTTTIKEYGRQPTKYDKIMKDAKEAVRQGAPKGAVKKRLMETGYTEKQLQNPYFNWLR